MQRICLIKSDRRKVFAPTVNLPFIACPNFVYKEVMAGSSLVVKCNVQAYGKLTVKSKQKVQNLQHYQICNDLQLIS